MKVLVASNSSIKLGAARDAFEGYSVLVDGRGSRSMVNEQPIGQDETLLGALNRLNQITLVQGYDFYIAIENGLELVGPLWLDFAVVAVANKSGIRKLTKSAGLAFPIDCVEEAKRRGFVTTTAGMIVAEKYGGSDTDPHWTLAGITRQSILAQAIEIVIGQFVSESNRR